MQSNYLEMKEKLLETELFKVNEYFNCYLNLIQDNHNTIQQKGYTQCHHIIPVSYYKLKGLKVSTITLPYPMLPRSSSGFTSIAKKRSRTTRKQWRTSIFPLTMEMSMPSSFCTASAPAATGLRPWVPSACSSISAGSFRTGWRTSARDGLSFPLLLTQKSPTKCGISLRKR